MADSSLREPFVPFLPSRDPIRSTELFTRIIESGLQSDLFALLATSDEPVTPTQTIFLKLLDSQLADPATCAPGPSTRSAAPNSFLVPLFHQLCDYALVSMQNVPDDGRLPKVFEALLLLSETFGSVGLTVQAARDASDPSRIPPGHLHLLKMLKEEQTGIVDPTIGNPVSPSDC